MRCLSAAKDILTCLENPPFFCKEAQAQTVCSGNANEPSGKSFKTKQTWKKRFAWLLFVPLKNLYLFAWNTVWREGPGVIRALIPHPWHPSAKPHDGCIWKVSWFPENTWCSSPEKGKQIYSFCELGTICSCKWQKKPFLLFSVANHHAELVWVEKDGLGLQPFMCWVQDLYQSQSVPPAWTQGCPQVSVRTSSGNRGSVQISLRQVSLRNLWYRWQWWVRRNKDLQLEKLFFLCKPSKYGMKIIAVQQTSICAVQLLSWRLLSEQSCAFSGDRQFFRARMAAASKCMYHCGWINKYPLKKPGSEE